VVSIILRKHSIMDLESSGFGAVCQGRGASFSSSSRAGGLPESVYGGTTRRKRGVYRRLGDVPRGADRHWQLPTSVRIFLTACLLGKSSSRLGIVRANKISFSPNTWPLETIGDTYGGPGGTHSVSPAQPG